MSQLFKQISCKSNSNVYAFSIKSFHLYRSYQKKEHPGNILGVLYLIYESNGELIDAFFPELSPKDKKRLWNIARKAFAYVYPGRFNFNIKEKVPKTPKEDWYKAHNINAEMTIAELIPMMHLIEKLKDIDAKDFWFTSYTNRHTTDTFGTMVINIGTHPYQHFITTLHYFWLLTKNSLFWGSDIQHIQNLMTEASIRKLSEICDSL